MTDIKFENAPDGTPIAYRLDGKDDLGRCGFVWLGGYKSDMDGSKAAALAALARETRRPGLAPVDSAFLGGLVHANACSDGSLLARILDFIAAYRIHLTDRETAAFLEIFRELRRILLGEGS